MATIGLFRKEGDEFSGSLETLTMRANLILSPNAKKSDNAPDYRVFQQTEHFTSEIGAAWKKTAKSGGEYLSVSIDDPNFLIECNLERKSMQPFDQQLLDLLSQAEHALNAAPRFQVDDSDSYAVAAAIGRAIKAAASRRTNRYIIEASVNMHEVWEIFASDEDDARQNFECGVLLRSDGYEPQGIISVRLDPDTV